MAKLLGSHILDCVRVCRVCMELTEARYDGSQILDTEDGTICEGRQYTCSCGATYNADLEPAPR